MKNRFKLFLFTYFYFTPQEKKGISALLLLFVLLQSLLWAIRLWAQPEPVLFQQIPFEVLLDSLEQKSINYSEEGEDSFSSISQNKRVPFLVRTEKKDSTYTKRKPISKPVVEINSCDSLDLISLPKIGPYMAHKILLYRSQLGGFYSLDQLTHIYGFQEDWLYDLESRLRIEPEKRLMLDLNHISFDELKKHPYFKYTLSRSIVQYRTQHGLYAQLGDLKKIKMVNDSIYQLILPYCELKP